MQNVAAELGITCTRARNEGGIMRRHLETSSFISSPPFMRDFDMMHPEDRQKAEHSV